MKQKLVTIAMATYNGERYVAQQLDSIFAQSYPNIEVVVVDDCSTDSTMDILRMYEKKFPMRVFCNSSNLGYVKNFEKAISLCDGEYIALCDQDDIWEHDKLEVLLSEIKDSCCVHSDASLIDHNGNLLHASFAKASGKLTLPSNIFPLAFNGCVTGCTVLFTSEFKNLILPFPEKLDVHDRWIGAVAVSINSLAYVPKPLIRYRQHAQNNIGAFDVNRNPFFIAIGWIMRNWRKIFTVDEDFLITFQKHANFINILLSMPRSRMRPHERQKLNSYKEVFERACLGRVKFKDLKFWFGLFRVSNEFAPFGYKVLYLVSILRNVVLLMILGCRKCV